MRSRGFSWPPFSCGGVASHPTLGVNPLDPGWWLLATLSLVVVAVLASVRPALVAIRVDVSPTLRAQ